MPYNNPMKVLAVADDEINLFIMTKILRDVGYNPIEAVGGTNAWLYIADNPKDVDIVMIDKMKFPKCTLDLVDKIRSQPESRFTPIILQNEGIFEEAFNTPAILRLNPSFQENAMRSIVDRAKYDVVKHQLLMKHLKKPTALIPTITYKTIDDAYPLAASLAQGAKDAIGVAEGLSEILINAVEHGNLGLGKAKKNFITKGTYDTEIKIRLEDPVLGARHATVQVEESANERVVTIGDEGKGFVSHVSSYKNAVDTINNICECGIAKARRLLGNVEFLGKGNTVRCSFDLLNP